MKKFISFVLCIIMCVSIFTATAVQGYAAGDANALFKITNSGVSDDEITYTVKLAAGQQKVTGAILKVAFDSSALQVVEGRAAGSYNADGDLVENVSGMYETGLEYNNPNSYALAYMNYSGYNVGNSDKDFFTIRFRIIAKERRLTSVEFNCVEFITDDGNDDNDIKKKTDGIQVIGEPHVFNTLSMPKITELNSINDSVKVVWSESVDADSYNLYRKETGASAWTLLAEGINALEYVDEDVEMGKQYFYTVSATNVYGSTEYDKTGKSIVLLETPRISAISNDVPGVALTWNAVKDATSYKIYRKTAGQSSWQYLTTVSGTTYTDTNVNSSTVYTYTVSAIIKGAETGHDNTGSSVMFLETPDLTSITNEVGGLSITWTTINGATGYRIYRRGAGSTYWTYLTTVTGNTYTDTTGGIKSGEYYRYTVRAANGNTFGGFDTNGLYLRYVATPKLTGISNAVSGLSITWGKVDGVTGYRIYRRGAGSTYWTYLTTVTGTTYTDTTGGITSGNYYRYTVRGANGSTFGGFDTNGLYLKYVATPKLTGISNAENGLYIKWNAVQNAKGYRVYRRGAGSTYWYYLGTTTNTYFTDAGVKNASGNYYRYTVRAVDGLYSAFDTTGLYLRRLVNPVLTSAKSSSAGITVKWNAVSGATGYYVYRKTSGTTWSYIGKVGATTSYVDKGAKKGTTYTYTVKAYYGNTFSSYNTKGISCKDLY